MGIATSVSIRASLHAQRRELVAAFALLVIVAVSAVVVASQRAEASPTAECWAHWDAREDQRHASSIPTQSDVTPVDPTCQKAIRVYWSLSDSVSKVGGLALFLPAAVGLLLGVPITARAQAGTTRASPRGLLAYTLMMLAVVVVSLTFVVLLLAAMRGLPVSQVRIPRLEDLVVAPLSYVARGILAFGLGLLAGAVSRRPVPAYALAAAALFLVVIVGGWGLHGVVAEGVAVLQEHCVMTDPDEGCEDPDWLYYLGSGLRDADGTFRTYDEARQATIQRCPSCDPESYYLTMAEVQRVAPIERYGTFEAAEGMVWTAMGLICIVLTFPVMSWHRRRDARRAGYPSTAATSTSG